MFTLPDVLFSSQGSDVEVEVPANLSKYMEAILAFTTHSSQVRWRHFFYCRLNFRYTVNESVEYESLSCFIACDSVRFLAVLEVVHSGYVGIFVQTWDSVEGSRCRGDGHQIPKSIDDQSNQGETEAPFTSKKTVTHHVFVSFHYCAVIVITAVVSVLQPVVIIVMVSPPDRDSCELSPRKHDPSLLVRVRQRPVYWWRLCYYVI